MIGDLLYGLFFIGLGASIIKYRKVIKSWTGNFVWAEHYIGRGGTYFAILLFGLGMIFYGAAYPFGGISSVLDDDAQDERESDRQKTEIKREINN